MNETIDSKLKHVLMINAGGAIAMVPDKSTGALAPAERIEDLLKADFLTRIRERENIQLDLFVDTADARGLKPIDSSDMTMDRCVKLAKLIHERISQYDGFVVLHGTDTMAYTASALSFCLENLSKPVILTGSQRSILEPRTDATQNLITSLCLAAGVCDGQNLPLIPMVCLFFGSSLFRGTRARYIGADRFMGFASPNYPPIISVGNQVEIDHDRIRPASNDKLFVHEEFEANVLSIDLYPGFSPDLLESILALENLRGLVLKTFGTGNAPSDPAFLSLLGQAVERGIVVVDVTQCVEGSVTLGSFATSSTLLECGVSSGMDMTPEAALTKLMFLFGQGYDSAQVRQYMQINIRGELSTSLFSVEWSGIQRQLEWTSQAKAITGSFEPERLLRANIRIQGLKQDRKDPSDPDSSLDVRLRVFVNLPMADRDTDTSLPQCVEKRVKQLSLSGAPTAVVFDATETVRDVINQSGLPVSLKVLVDGAPVSWDKIVLSIIAHESGQ